MATWQELLTESPETIKSFRATISEVRFAKYLASCNGNEKAAIKLYHWNSLLSQSMYLPLQMWEVALRNRINTFLQTKYGLGWTYDPKVARQLATHDGKRLHETIERQKRVRKVVTLTNGVIVADLSAGFWVSMLSRSYDVPFGWRQTQNMRSVFPHRALQRQQAWRICNDLLELRNRVAHHEPVFHLPLPTRRSDLALILAALCEGTQAYAENLCSFAKVWAARPAG